jgi:iron complex transport system ATP-binding protein
VGGPEADGVVLAAVDAAYGSHPVLRGVSLEAPSGLVTGLIGPNGSGKTTIIRVASRGLRPTSGEVRIHGTDPYALTAREVARLVAVVPQEVVPAFEYSVHEMVSMGRSPYRRPWGRGGEHDWPAVREAMGRTGLLHLASRSMGELSGGEGQRVVLSPAPA